MLAKEIQSSAQAGRHKQRPVNRMELTLVEKICTNYTPNPSESKITENTIAEKHYKGKRTNEVRRSREVFWPIHGSTHNHFVAFSDKVEMRSFQEKPLERETRGMLSRPGKTANTVCC